MVMAWPGQESRLNQQQRNTGILHFVQDDDAKQTEPNTGTN
jgi:hypothetical protein